MSEKINDLSAQHNSPEDWMGGRRIKVYKPMREGDMYIALITRVPMIFRARTAIGAKRMAAEWAAKNIKRYDGYEKKGWRHVE